MLVYGCSGLVTPRRLEPTKTTIDKSGKQITIEISSKWALEWSSDKAEIAVVKSHYKMGFVTSKSYASIDQGIFLAWKIL